MSDARLHRVTVLIKTFLRDNFLFDTVAAIQASLPEVQMLIIDDGDMTEKKSQLYFNLEVEGHKVRLLPFDSGFGAKSNLAIDNCDRPYLLIGSDDFGFSPLSVREGILKLVDVLDDGYVDIASGRYNNNPYESWLIVDADKGIVEEHPLDLNQLPCLTSTGTAFFYCDLTVNYGLVRAEVLGWQDGQIHWDSDVKIGGGEHGAFYYDAKKAGLRVAYVPGVNIGNQEYPKTIDPRYRKFRQRALSPARPCFEYRGIKKYVCADGTVDWYKP